MLEQVIQDATTVYAVRLVREGDAPGVTAGVYALPNGETDTRWVRSGEGLTMEQAVKLLGKLVDKWPGFKLTLERTGLGAGVWDDADKRHFDVLLRQAHIVLQDELVFVRDPHADSADPT